MICRAPLVAFGPVVVVIYWQRYVFATKLQIVDASCLICCETSACAGQNRGRIWPNCQLLLFIYPVYMSYWAELLECTCPIIQPFCHFAFNCHSRPWLRWIASERDRITQRSDDGWSQFGSRPATCQYLAHLSFESITASFYCQLYCSASIMAGKEMVRPEENCFSSGCSRSLVLYNDISIIFSIISSTSDSYNYCVVCCLKQRMRPGPN